MVTNQSVKTVKLFHRKQFVIYGSVLIIVYLCYQECIIYIRTLELQFWVFIGNRM